VGPTGPHYSAGPLAMGANGPRYSVEPKGAGPNSLQAIRLLGYQANRLLGC